MNIYQNGAFSEILHKLTKYQALAASAKDFSKHILQSLFSHIFLHGIEQYGHHTPLFIYSIFV